MPELHAIICSVDYSDILSVTLPKMRHHFDHVTVVTTPQDIDTIQVACDNQAETFKTTLFQPGFRKYPALEAALEHIGRKGWLCLLDADIVWPHSPTFPELNIGYIYGPACRRILNPVTLPLPDQSTWHSLPIQKNSTRELCGFTQIFHAADPHLGHPPWHDISLTHAGAGDSYLARKWPREHQIRLTFEALHLGQNGQDWHGRLSPRLISET